MQRIPITPEQEKEREKRIKSERRKRNFTMLIATLSGDGIPENDERTIQAHPDHSGGTKSYYIINAFLQGDTNSFDTVREIVKEGRYFYWGVVSGADNVVGVLETNVPIGQIIKRPTGNYLLQDVLKEEKISAVRDSYYDSIGEEKKPLQGHMNFFGKPSFPMGKIIMSANNKFVYTPEPSIDVLEQLKEQREKEQKDEQMRNPEDIEINIGGGLVVPKQNAWMEQKGNTILFKGVNDVGLQYIFSPIAQLPKTNDGYYVQIGSVEIGRRTVGKTSEEQVFQFVNPYHFDDIVVWTQGKPLAELMHNLVPELNFALGDIFTEYSISDKKEQSGNSFVFAGGVIIDSEGTCKVMEEVPASVKRVAESYFRRKDGNFPTNIRLVEDKMEKTEEPDSRI